MQYASGVLAETHLTIAAVGHAVGYENEFAFSNAFKRWSRGTPPSTYRLRTHSAA
jgi:AraC-like DNA-binding protein